MDSELASYRYKLGEVATAFAQSFPVIDEINKAIEAGALGPELCPERDYWHWDVLQPTKLGDRLRGMYNEYGEVRWYGTREY